ncbi:MAG: NRDE family protein, partial [Spongiibacteraceae bacterium]|nr:NRDE family protein [Spongiibacteraceae bacterium]
MCLIILALEQHPDWPLLIAANRDEHHQRPSRAAAPWAENSA